mgnify:FL=1
MDLEDITAEMSRSLDALKIIYEKLEIELGEKSCFMQNAEQRELLYTLYALSHIIGLLRGNLNQVREKYQLNIEETIKKVVT